MRKIKDIQADIKECRGSVKEYERLDCLKQELMEARKVRREKQIAEGILKFQYDPQYELRCCGNCDWAYPEYEMGLWCRWTKDGRAPRRPFHWDRSVEPTAVCANFKR